MAPRQHYSLTQMQSRLSDRLQRSPFWTTAELTAYLNEALRVWSALTGYWKKRVLLTTIRTLPYYNLAGYLTFGMHVEFNGTPLIQSSCINWDKGYPYWEGQPSATGPIEWAPIGISLFAIRPPDLVGSNSLIVDGVASAPVLGTVADPTKDFIDIGDEELDALLKECQYLAAFKEGGQEFESALPLHQAFLKAAAVKNEKLNASAVFRRAMGIDNEQAGQRPRRVPSMMQPVGAR
jgi:hypothetical protein